MCSRKDLNPQPSVHKTNALTDCATRAYRFRNIEYYKAKNN